MRRLWLALVASAFVLVASNLVAAGAFAQGVIDGWADVKAPAAPALKPVTIDPKTTALLMLDYLPPNCGRNPRCMASVPKAAALLDAMRAHKGTVIFTVFPPNGAKDILKEVSKRPDEKLFSGTVDKFIGTALDRTLKAKHIKTVIVIGSGAHGAVLFTGAGAAQRGYDVIVPVDGMASPTPYLEQLAVSTLSTASTVAPHVTLTSFAQIGF